MMDDDSNYFSYTNRQYLKETKRLKYQRLIKNYKDKKEITTVENKLSEFNSKSCILDEFNILCFKGLICYLYYSIF